MSLDRVSACLDEQTLAALISGELDASELGVVDAHLANCRDCRCVVGDAAYGAADQPPSDSGAGAQVARTVVAEKYRIDGLLGRGGMGVVFSARHIDLGHRVAIKVVSSNDASAAARLLREAKTCAHLESDHIARVFDLGTLPSGLPYFVMEHLVGEDLSKLIARGPVPPALAIEFMIQACSALRAAHAAGVIHRDLKPGNLFVVNRPDGKPWLKVLDFGLSKLVPGGSLETSDSLTQSQSILGSPLYMSPEQIRATEVLDARSDIWSIGVILYELLSARRPFNAPAVSALLIAITTETPPPLSTLVADLPDGLEAIVMRCLQKDLADRYPSVTALADALHRVATGGPNSRHGYGLRPASTNGQRRVVAGLVLGMLGLGAWSLLGKRLDGGLMASSAVRSAAMVQTFKAAPAPAPLSLRVRCDGPLPTGVQVLIRAEAAQGASDWIRKFPLAALCEAETSDTRRKELLAQWFGAPAALRVALEPARSFYRIDVAQNAETIEVQLTRLERDQVKVQLLGPLCARVEKVSVRTLTMPAAAHVLATRPVATSNACELQVELPFEATGQRHAFNFEPSGFWASDTSLTAEGLRAEVRRLVKPRTEAAAPNLPSRTPNPCPPYCRD